ncbi:MAG TPA: AI-2E family transporter, partial [Acidobacteriaceae bacterium]|nr:AI-2E family transporter [Acidobacteriaceae bacterium]
IATSPTTPSTPPPSPPNKPLPSWSNGSTANREALLYPFPQTHPGCTLDKHPTSSTQGAAPLPYPTTPESRSSAAIRGHIVFAIGLLVALGVAWRLREVLTLIYVSGLFAVVLMPVVDSIVLFETRGGRRISRAPAIALILGAVFLAIGLLFALGLPPVIRDMRQFAADLPGRIPGIVARLKRIPLADKLGVDSVASRVEGGLSVTAEYLFASFPAWMGRIFDLVTAVVLCIYFMLEGNQAYLWIMSLFPVNSRLRLAVTLEKAEIRMSKWLIGQGLLMLILGVCSTIAFYLLHVRYFALLGVLMGLMNIIPIAGGVITILIVGAVAALDSWSKTGGVFLFYLAYVNVENAYLTPRIMRSSVNLMGLTVLISLIAGTELAGVVGALVAVPTAALIAVLMEEYMVQNDSQYTPADAPSTVPPEDPILLSPAE